MIPLPQPRFRYLGPYRNKAFCLLDVGCGNHSPSITRRVFPRVKYYGLDKTSYNNDDRDMALMEQFYPMDLDGDDLHVIPDNYFDVVLMCHVIEHLVHGEQALSRVCGKLKRGGHLYIEWPGPRSVSLPSACGTLNFYDDPTHVRVYNRQDIGAILVSNGLTILKAGTRRDPVRLMLTPLILAYSLWYYPLHGQWPPGLWDFFGFAEFCFAQKPGA